MSYRIIYLSFIYFPLLPNIPSVPILTELIDKVLYCIGIYVVL